MTTLKDPETVYFAADEAAGQIIEQLRAPDTTRADRARLLHELADLEERMGVAQAAAWPEDQTPDEDGFTPLQSRTLSALTLHYLAAAEDAASRGPRKRAPHSWEVAAGPLLDEYAAAGGPGERAVLLELLHAALYPLIGNHAAEVIETLRRAYLDAADKTTKED